MKRIALLPTPGDPFLISYWLRRFTEWRDRVDALHVCVSWPQEPEVIARITHDVEAAGGRVIHAKTSGPILEHGPAMELLLGSVETTDRLFFTEDDLYINDPNIVSWGFDHVDRACVFVGVPRASMSMELIERLREQYPSGAALWPVVWGRAEDFRTITEPFGARVWYPGEEVKGSGLACVGECSADTFGAASMELREHYGVIEAEYWSPNGRWHHVGSLSTGPFVEDQHLPHAREWKGSWDTRRAWWQRFYDEWPGGLEKQHAAYGAALDRLRATLG